MILLKAYIIFGAWFYLYMAVTNIHTFKDADYKSILRGLLFGLLLWPLALYWIVLWLHRPAIPKIKPKKKKTS